MSAWRLAWLSAFRRRRLFAWNVVVPALLLTPVALSDAAAPHRTAVFGVFFVFFGVFGSAIPTVRDASEGWLDALFGGGLGRRAWLAQTVAAGALIDALQLLPTVLVLGLTAPTPTGTTLGRFAAGLLLALVSANLLGPLIAAAVRSLAEAALAGSAASLVLLHLAGFFRPPRPGWTGTLAAWSPFRPLAEGLTGLQGGDPSFAAVGWISAATAAGALVLTAGRWTRRFDWPAPG